MSKFKFKLQKLLDIKIKDEEESKLEYVNAQNKKKLVESNLRNLEFNYKKYSDITKISDAISQKITINYLTSLTKTIKITKEQLEKEKIIVNSKKEELIQKQIKRKSLEILKDNELARLKKEEDRVEQIANDEFALYGHIRKKANAL